MPVAETARLAVEMTLGGNFNAGMSQSEASLSRMNAAASGAQGKASALSSAFGSVGKAAGSAGGALSHAGSQLKGLLTGPLGLIGLTGGLLAVGKGLTDSVGKASEFAFAIEKMQGLTNDSADSLARLIAVTDNYGISADRLAKVVGFTEKSLGQIALSSASAAKFAKDYGFSVTDASGRVLGFNAVLLKAADYYNGNASQAAKAALAAKLFGRNYTDLVPVLKLGSQGIRDAEQAAADLGITLNATNVRDLAAFRTATRDMGDAVTGLQLQIGLGLVPSLTELANAAREFIAGHRGDIVAFFRNAVDAGKAAVGVIGQVAGTLGHAWDSIPPELRDFLVKGAIADRTVKFLFGFSPVGALFSGIESALSKAVGTGIVSAGLGKLFVQPVFVTNQGFGQIGNLLGGAGGAAEGGAAAAGGAGLLTVALSAAAVTAIGGAVTLGMFYGIPALLKAVYGDRPGPGEGYVNNPYSPTAAPVSTGETLGIPKLAAAEAHAWGSLGNLLDAQATATLADRTDSGAHGSGTDNAMALLGRTVRDAGYEVDNAVLKGASWVVKPLDALHRSFADAMHTLRSPGQTPAAIRAAAARAAADIVKGVGSLKTTNATLATLRAAQAQAIKSGNTALARALGADIKKVESKVPGRTYVERQIALAQKIERGTGTANQKADQLKAIQNRLVARGDLHAANEVAKLNALIRKPTKITVNTTNNISTSVSIRDVNRGSQTRARYTGHTGFQAI